VVLTNYVSIMPTLDYYGFEHEDAITGAQGANSSVCGKWVLHRVVVVTSVSIVLLLTSYGYKHEDAVMHQYPTITLPHPCCCCRLCCGVLCAAVQP
jgi:hypothetical protein